MKFSEVISFVAKKRQSINIVVDGKLARSQLTDRFVRAIPYIFGVFAETNSTRILLSNESSIDIFDANWVKSYPNIKCSKVDDEVEQVVK